jgi:hypothetical protein
MNNLFNSSGIGSGILPATPAKCAALNRAQIFQQTLDSPAIRREIDAKARGFVHDRLTKALRRGGNSNFTIRL